MCLVAPYPFRDEPLDEFNVTRDFYITSAGEVWYSRPQLFFKCTLCPTGAMENTNRHKEFSLVFFNTFEPISLTPDSCMQQKGVPMLYERAANQVPTLYVCPVDNVLRRVPLLPCYLKGNTVNTNPHSCRSQIPKGAAADSRPDNGTGSRLFEVNISILKYGRPFPRKYSVEEAVALRKKRVQESRARGAAMLQRRLEAAASKMGVQLHGARAMSVIKNGVSDPISYTISYPICVTI